MLARYLRWLERTGPWCFGAAVFGLAAWRLAGGAPWMEPAHLGGAGLPGELLPAAVLVLGWLVAAGAWNLARPITPEAAIAAWGRRLGDHETLLSAWVYEQHADPTPGEALHLARARERLAEAAPHLARTLPARAGYEAFGPPLVLLAFAASSLLASPPPPESPPLARPALERAAELGQTLAEQRETLDRLLELDPEDREEAGANVREQLERAAARLKSLDERATAESVLRELEALARAAEALREAMGEGQGPALSRSMLDALEQHTDTAELGAALRREAMERAATEAEALGEKLDEAHRTRDVARRIREALEAAQEAAEAGDLENPVGRELEAAAEALRAGDPKEAGERFEAMARQLARAAARARRRQRLAELAEGWREAGQQVVQRDAGAARALARAGPEGGRPLGRPEAPGRAMARRPLEGDAAPGAAGGGGEGENDGAPGDNPFPFPMPGEAEAGDRPPVPGTAAAGGGDPAPGERDAGGPPPRWGGGRGEQPAGDDGPPVPGTFPFSAEAGREATEGGMGEGAGEAGRPGGMLGQSPGKGPGQASASGAVSAARGDGGGVGGHEAGSGSAELGRAAPLDPGEAGEAVGVQATPSGEGPAVTRQIEGRRKTGRRSPEDPRALALEALTAEEAALSAEPLPLSRRDQVLRYFTLVRRTLEHTP